MYNFVLAAYYFLFSEGRSQLLNYFNGHLIKNKAYANSSSKKLLLKQLESFCSLFRTILH